MKKIKIEFGKPYTPEEIEANKLKVDPQEKIAEIKIQLNELNYDLLQDQAGLVVPDLATKKQQFIDLHSELRTLLNKQPRAVK